MRALQSGRWVLAALAIALSTSACGQAPQQPKRKAAESLPAGIEQGRTVNGRTYTNAPVDVKLGPNTYRIPANYLDSQIAPWPGEGVTLVIEWPDMKPTYPGARVHPRTNDFRKEIQVLVSYVDRVPIASLLDRIASNEATTEPGSLSRENPSNRLDLRLRQPEVNGLTPYAIDEAKLKLFAEKYEKQSGRPFKRSVIFENDWYVARSPDGQLRTLIKCDSPEFLRDGVAFDGEDVISVPGETAAGCVHYITDLNDSWVASLNYKRAFLGKWSQMERAVRDVLSSSRVN